MTIPDGNVSEKPTPVRGTPFGLTMLNIRSVVAPSEIKISVKVFVRRGGLFTLQLALANALTPPVTVAFPVTWTVSA